MTESKNDQHTRQPVTNFVQQSTQPAYASDPDKISIEVQEVEEWDEVITNQRRPQFRCSENYGRRNS